MITVDLRQMCSPLVCKAADSWSWAMQGQPFRDAWLAAKHGWAWPGGLGLVVLRPVGDEERLGADADGAADVGEHGGGQPGAAR